MLYQLSILTLICNLFVSKSDESKTSDNCNHPLESYRFGGNNMGWVNNLVTNTKPVIFPCTYDSGGAKWLRFRVNKKQGPLDIKDKILMLMASGMKCEEGTQINPSSIDAKSILCDLKESDITCPVSNIRVSDTVSDPFVQTVCVIAFCGNDKIGCSADIQVEFYDQFARPSEITRIMFGCTWLDLFAFLLGIIMIGVTCGIFYGLFGKYYEMLKEKRDLKLEMKQRLNDKKKQKIKTH